MIDELLARGESGIVPRSNLNENERASSPGFVATVAPWTRFKTRFKTCFEIDQVNLADTNSIVPHSKSWLESGSSLEDFRPSPKLHLSAKF